MCDYHKMGCKMSLKVHFLHSHLPFFQENLGAVSNKHDENLGAVSNKHGERFHQNITVIEKRFKGLSGQLEYSPNTAGHQNEISQNKNTKEDDVEFLFSFCL